MQWTNVLTVIGGAFVVWSALTMAGGYLADEPLREHGKKAHTEKASAGGGRGMQSTSAEHPDHPEHPEHSDHTDAAAANSYNPEAEAMIVQLRARVKEEPKNADRLTELGYAMLAYGLETNDASRLIEALSHFDSALAINPEQQQALLGIAGVSLRVGVLDKAEDYYRRYIALSPNDIRALSDYGLTLVRLGKHTEAEITLKQALSVDPHAVPALMVFAMLERERGNQSEAKRYAQEALTRTDDAAMRQGVEGFLLELEPNSARSRGEQFFRQHPIVGPKVVEIEQRGTTLRVVVLDFPVSQMPEVAKQRFVSTIQAEFASVKDQLSTVDIVDRANGAVLLSVTVEPGQPSAS